MGRTEYLVAEIRSLSRALGCSASVYGGSDKELSPLPSYLRYWQSSRA